MVNIGLHVVQLLLSWPNSAETNRSRAQTCRTLAKSCHRLPNSAELVNIGLSSAKPGPDLAEFDQNGGQLWG